MKKRIHLKKKKKKSHFSFFFTTVIVAFLTSVFLIFLTTKKLEKVIIRYASIETKRIVSTILNDIVRSENLEDHSLYQIKRNKDDEVEFIDFNTKEVNKILKKINEKARGRLLALEHGDTKDIALSNGLKGIHYESLKNGVVCDIPLGVLTGNAFLIGTSTVIPIRFSFVGSVESNLESKVKSYGVNNALVELSIKVTITEQVTMPHTAKEVEISSYIPLVIELIEGKVPLYYQDNLDKNSTEQTLSIF